MNTALTRRPDLTDLFAQLVAADWDDTDAVLAQAQPLFDLLTADLPTLDSLLITLPGNEQLAGLCEQYDFMSKLVLLDDPTGVRLRLHLYREGFFDRPHNHRWSFASHILRGSYRHRIYGSDEHFTEQTDPATLRPVIERDETSGSRYVLHHTAVHTVQAEKDTISLLLRGPAAKDRFLIHDVNAGQFFWVQGAAQESPEQRASKQMTGPQLADTISHVRQLIGTTEPTPASAPLEA